MESITLGQIITALGLAMALGSGIVWILKPVKAYNDREKKIEDRIKKVEEHQNEDNNRLLQLEKDTKQILLCVNTLMSHSIDNNHIDQLKKRKAELDAYLIER